MKKMDSETWNSYLITNVNLPIEFTTEEMQQKTQIHLNKIPFNCQNILDLGAGDGYAAEFLMSKNKKVIATSLNSQEVEYMLQRGVKAQREDMHNLSFENDSFDCVYMRQVLEHALAPFLVFSEIARVLKHNGYWLLIVPPELDLLSSSPNYIYMHNSATKHYSVLTEIQLKTLWEKVNFVFIDKWILKTPNGMDIAYLLKKE